MRNNASVVYNVFLIIGDFLALVAAFTVAYILRVSVSSRILSAEVSSSTYIGILVALLPFWIFIFALLGLYNAKVYEKRFSELGRIFIGSFIGILFAISYAYIANIELFPGRLVTVYALILAALFVFLFRTIIRGLRRELFSYGIGINNVLLVGDTPTTHSLIGSLANTSITGYRVVGFVGGEKHPLKVGTDIAHFKSFSEAVTALDKTQLHTIMQTELYSKAERNDEILTYAQKHHVAYRFVPGNSELFVGNLEVDLFHSVPIITVHQTPLVGWGQVVKRLFDIFASGILLIVLSPVFLLVALAVKLSDGGSIVLKQQRLSRYDRPVGIYKFRSHNKTYNGLLPEEAFAKMGKPELIHEYRASGDHLDKDPRITPVGRFIRKYSLDELPQIFNVFKGDISLVGPRALVPNELERYDKKSLILSVKSGLTGLAQISGVRDLSFEQRRALDLYYVQNWSFWGDIVILIKTISVVLFHKGTRS